MKYDVIIIGGGITGASLFYVLSNYTNIDSLALIEKCPDLGQINSRETNNSQTLHFGDIETNYDLEKAKAVKEAATMMEAYFERKIKEEEGNIFIKTPKMVLGVGRPEAETLKKRFETFKDLYPDLKILDREAIGRVEPEILNGRPEDEEILALYSENSYTVDFGRLAGNFVHNSLGQSDKTTDIFLKTKVKKINDCGEVFEVVADGRSFYGETVAVAAGAHSLLFAKSLCYGEELFLLPMAGNFYCSKKKFLRSKVYSIQDEKLPFAAVHADPNIRVPGEVRFGPTAKALPILERGNLYTLKDFFKTNGLDLRMVRSIVSILSDRTVFRFVLKNLLYDLPFFGKLAFVRTARKIIPSLSYRDLSSGKGLGGIRPQLINKNTRKLMMGEAEILGRNIIFNVTPSPGATAALKSAEHGTRKIINFLKGYFAFEEERFKKDFYE